MVVIMWSCLTMSASHHFQTNEPAVAKKKSVWKLVCWASKVSGIIGKLLLSSVKATLDRMGQFLIFDSFAH